jgi:hypothetical protein
MTAKKENIDKSSDNGFMNIRSFRETDCFAAESLNAGSQSQMIPLNFLRILLSDNQLIRRNVIAVSKISVRVNLSNMERFQ